jgi:hypothetical protein
MAEDKVFPVRIPATQLTERDYIVSAINRDGSVKKSKKVTDLVHNACNSRGTHVGTDCYDGMLGSVLILP